MELARQRAMVCQKVLRPRREQLHVQASSAVHDVPAACRQSSRTRARALPRPCLATLPALKSTSYSSAPVRYVSGREPLLALLSAL